MRSESRKRPLSLASLAAITVATLSAGIASISYSSTFVRNGADQYLELRAFLRDEGESYSTLYTDQGAYQSTGLVVPMYTRSILGSPSWEGEVLPLGVDDEFLPLDQIEGDLVVVRPRSIRRLVGRAYFNPPPYLTDPPASWVPAMISENGQIVAYAVAPGHPSTALHTVSAREWRIIEENGTVPARNATIENGHVVIEAGANESILIFDRRGERSGPPEPSDEVPVDSGDVLWGRIQMATEGDGIATIRCYFYGRDGAIITDAAAREPHGEALESIDYRCPAPPAGGPFQVRVAIFARQRVTVTLGENTVFTTEGEKRPVDPGDGTP